MKAENTCTCCCWWMKRADLEFENYRVGDCRKNAPVSTTNNNQWPITEHTDWCGDFKEEGNV